MLPFAFSRRCGALTSAAYLVLASAPVLQAEETAGKRPISAAAELAGSAIRVDDGYRVDVVASEPNLANPVAFCFAPDGRIFVAETHRILHGVEDNRQHMDWVDDDLAARTVADRRAYVERRMADRIGFFTERSEAVRLLEDRDGDGLYEHAGVYADGFDQIEAGAAAGVLWVDDRLLLTCIPSLWELRDDDANGHAEQKRSLAAGFGVHFALFGHDLHGLCEGPDGKIYFSIGDRGCHVETPTGTLDNPDSGAVFRCNRDGSELEMFATGLRNPQELVFNEFGDLFTADNNSDSGDRARIVHIVEGMDVGWRMSYQYLPDRGPFNREKIWHTCNDDQSAGIVPPIAHLGDGPSGLVYYPGTGMPDDCRGMFFLADFRGAAASSGVRRFRLEPHGAAYRLAADDMFLAGALATDCEFGPDGNLYVLDWIDGWHGLEKGRIHRVTHDDLRLAQARNEASRLLQEIASLSLDELTSLLSHPNMRVRLAAQRRLAAMGDAAVAALMRLAESTDAHQLARIHAMWAMASLAERGEASFDPLKRLCGDADAEIRRQAARSLGYGHRAPQSQRAAWGAALAPLLGDPEPRVQVAAALALGALKYQPALAPLLKLASDNADRDPVIRHAAVMGLAGSQSPAELVAAGRETTPAGRTALALALARQRSPLTATFLQDEVESVVLAAARAIWDAPISEAYEPLAAILDRTPSANEPLVRRALAANHALGAAEQLQAVVRCAVRGDLSADMREHAWSLVRQWPVPSPRDPVHGLWRPLEARPQAEVVAALEAVWPEVLQASATEPLGVVVAAELGLPTAFEHLLPIIRRSDANQDVQTRAIAALSASEASIAEQAVDAGLKSADGGVRSAARRLLAERFPAKAVGHLRNVAASAPTAERQAALQQLAKIDLPEAQAVVGEWMDCAEQGSCPPEILLDVLEAAAVTADSALAQRQRKYVDERTAHSDPAVAYGACLTGGDAARGEQLFSTSEALSCRRCHSLQPGEQLVGPSLADVGVRRTRGEILESITRPNAKIVEGFQTTAMLLDTGQIVSGLLRGEDDKRAVLLNADGHEIEVDLTTVEERTQGLSAMPEDLMKYMTPRDLRDLVEFLSSQRNVAADGDSSEHKLD